MSDHITLFVRLYRAHTHMKKQMGDSDASADLTQDLTKGNQIFINENLRRAQNSTPCKYAYQKDPLMLQ
jgi:hypothetical protein